MILRTFGIVVAGYKDSESTISMFKRLSGIEGIRALPHNIATCTTIMQHFVLTHAVSFRVVKSTIKGAPCITIQ
jgi:hypothetical protein